MFKAELVSSSYHMGQRESMEDPILTYPTQPGGYTHSYHSHPIGENESCARRTGKT